MDMSIWYLVGAILVFFMQAGFAMVESGLTRAKNAGNIIMKNLMDFCIGTVVFMLLGYGIMNSESYFFGLIGLPEYQLFTGFYTFDWSNFFFQLVFCATAATIVSGAMAERTKFSSYCIYSAVISAVVYPIEAGWVWNGQGWLAQLGFIDFAGSCVIHMVGGISGLIGAILLGPRIGKYGKDGNSRAILGHNIPIAALGTFILWFCWYGFNGAAASDPAQLAQILGNTTIAPAVATVVCMLFTWIKNGKPDVGMCLNAPLAGLVGITAGCADLDAVGSLVVGVVTGVLVVVVVELLDMKLHIDDPVGAVAVHGSCGMAGTLLTGLLATEGGLLYGGGLRQLGVQCLGVVAVAAYTGVVMTIVFQVIKHTNGLRVTPEEEVAGLDATEHGLPSAYADFSPNTSITALPAANAFPEPAPAPAAAAQEAAMAEAVPVHTITRGAAGGRKLSNVTILCNQAKFEELKTALNGIGVTGMTVSQVLGCGIQKGKTEYYRGVPLAINLLPKVQVEIVVSKVPVEQVVNAARQALYTGRIGDGKIFVYDVENVIKVRTGEEGYDALQGEE
ncbi:ammonium transporter [Flavonifractor sp. DFI.6.63]|uniref:Ammonium transporter n=1 Tax=Lawsonibacter hominis TaxID=2763053 RepID=A0A8J6MF22_9FIRM|nr:MULTISPECIES: ammonium transporter [Oscillospiraceae]MBS1384659.1 ammonium transporter [Flavonifractor sp.]MDU2196610.1 ammonium transporter [Clostridiales bacterium]MDY2978204.1 ammonium transporter [Oscillospiraceae bacterium]MBC5733893.1 ammonium transporter [Lawsonibacter hominis]MCI6398953.1 ammonium transporter [Lawsonibacter sp.]